jgi:hypothetical protein
LALAASLLDRSSGVKSGLFALDSERRFPE